MVGNLPGVVEVYKSLHWIHLKTVGKHTAGASQTLCTLQSTCVIPYQAFEAARFGHDLPRNEINGTM